MVTLRNIASVILLFTAAAAFPQQDSPNYRTFTARIGHTDTLIKLPERLIMQYSEILTLQQKTLKPGDDYRINYNDGEITLNKKLFSNLQLDTFQIYNVQVVYDVFPYAFKDEYSNFEMLVQTDTLTGDTVEIATQKSDFVGSIFEGTDLTKSGSLFRGFSVGNNRDLTLNSGFRLQLNGKLASDLEINAALTDEDSPIQPEGNTQKLQELDKVFIEIRGNNFTGTIGDINVGVLNTQFINFSRKIQGAKAYADYGFGEAEFSGAIQRGKFNINSFNGIDGTQGPYRLIGRENETDIVVLSGTEKVYLDGVPMTRGEQADYVIDYGIGSVTFTNNRLITSASRIIVEFEYTDRKYSRAILTGSNTLRLLNKKMSLYAHYIGENDNPDKTIDFSLTPEDREIIAQAGDDRFKAVKSGVVFVGTDTATGIGRGLYVKSDTVVSKENITVYKYLPNDSASVYQVVFSFVGQGNGNYSQQSLQQYNFAGLKQGSYDTVIFIPIPNSYQVADIGISYESSPKREFTFDLESALSLYDANKLSSIDDDGNGGFALNGKIAFRKERFDFLGLKLYSIEFEARQKLVNKSYVPLERYNPVEFYREYNIQDTEVLTEDLKEASLAFSPVKFMNVKALFGQLKRGSVFNSLRAVGDFAMRNDTLRLPDILYRIEYISSRYDVTGSKSNWLRQYGNLSYRNIFGDMFLGEPSMELGLSFNQENRQNFSAVTTGDSLSNGSFAFFEVRPRLILNNFQSTTIYGEAGYRQDRLPVNGFLKEESNALTYLAGIRYEGLSWMTTLFELTVRNKKYTEEFTTETNKNNNTLLVNWQTSVDPFNGGFQTDLFYNITSERQAKVERVFVPVPVGQGNYIYLGDLNGNGLQDENEFQLTTFNDGNYVRINRPTSELFPVTGLNTSARFNIRPSRFFNITGSGFGSELLRNVTAETYLRVEENSKDPDTKNVYMLDFATFQNDSNTLFGTQLFQQDINFFEFNPQYSLKLRFLQQESFNQFVSGNERLFTLQRLARLKLGLTKDLTLNFEYSNRVDRNEAPVASVRNRNIYSDGLLGDFSYRPVQEIESGFTIGISKATDVYPEKPVIADINQQTLRFIYSFAMLGRLRVEFERGEVNLNQSNIIYPFELTTGRQEGRTFIWRGIFDYSISKNLQATINYDGRVEGSNTKVIHTGRAEIKAFF